MTPSQIANMPNITNTPNATVAMITAGDATILMTGSVIAFENRPIELSFSLRETLFSVTLQQETDPKNPQPRWEIGTVGDPEKIRVRLINIQNNPIGGIPQPLRLWTGPDDSIYMQLRHVSIPTLSTMFHFTIYLKPESKPILVRPHQFETQAAR
jgi:hypothetical protein